jgi:lysophospholipase L1-like esterase
METGSADDNTGTAGRINYSNEWVKTYNAAALEVMGEMGVVVNDLYALCMEDDRRYKCEDLLHLSAEGNRRCAAQVADYIRTYAE